MIEKFYIIGKLGGGSGFQIYDLQTNTRAQNGQDLEFLDTFHNIDNRKELFKVSRVGFRTYHTYIRFELSKERTGCMLGFSYVYEYNGTIITDILGLRKHMKEALNNLLDKDNIKINSFNDNSVIASLNHIKEFAKKVNADPLSFPNNSKQFSVINPQDLTNEKILEMLKQSVNVEISEDVPTALSTKEFQIKNLSTQNQQQQIIIQQKDSEIQKLNNEKESLIKTNKKLEEDLQNANNRNGNKDRKIRESLKEIEKYLSPSHKGARIDDDETPQPSPKVIKKEFILLAVAILLIVNIIIGVLGLLNNSKEDDVDDLSNQPPAQEETINPSSLQAESWVANNDEDELFDKPAYQEEKETYKTQVSLQTNKKVEQKTKRSDKEIYDECLKDSKHKEEFTKKLQDHVDDQYKKDLPGDENKQARYDKLKDEEKYELHKKWYAKKYE